MAYRVIQWATGGVGRGALEGILDHPELELVGCWVHSPEKAGKDVGERIGREPVGVTAISDTDAVLAMDADCVLYAPLLAQTPEVVRILESGKNVVTPLGWFYPKAKTGPRWDGPDVANAGPGVEEYGPLGAQDEVAEVLLRVAGFADRVGAFVQAFALQDPPGLLAPSEEGPGARWVDDYFTVERLDDEHALGPQAVHPLPEPFRILGVEAREGNRRDLLSALEEDVAMRFP